MSTQGFAKTRILRGVENENLLIAEAVEEIGRYRRLLKLNMDEKVAEILGQFISDAEERLKKLRDKQSSRR